MSAAPARPDELACLRALQDLHVLDSAPEDEFDALVRAAALACQMPISLISLIDSDRQWFKANQGLPEVQQTPRDQAFCAHAVLGEQMLEVPDALLDPRFADNPLVCGAPGIRFYAGMPLRLDNGARVGTLCVIDHHPRQLQAAQREVLRQLAVVAARALQARTSTLAVRSASQAVLASEARFRALSEGAPLGIFATDRHGGCTYVNPRWQEIFGMQQAEAQGQGWARCIHPTDRNLVVVHWLQITDQRQEFNLAFRIQRADGSVRSVQARARAICGAHDAVEGYVGTVEDVTEHRRMAELVARTGRIAAVGGWELDLRTRVLAWSAQTRAIHEVADDYVPRVDTAIAFYAEAVRPQIDAALEMGMTEGIPWNLELPLVTARGRLIWVRSQGDVDFEDGQPVRLVGAIQDITEQRGRRLALQHEQALRAALQTQMAHTEQLLRERSEMLDVMAHEVRQPLNNASAAMQSAALALDGLSERVATPRLGRARTVLAQVLASIDNTLAVAALLGGAHPIERADTDIDALLRVAIADVPQPQRQRIQVQRHTTARTASMDMGLMRLALRNLLNNALQHSPADTPVLLHLRDSDDPLALLIDVEDAGGGIPVDLLPRLFERNIHRGKARARSGQGLGLGLYIVGRVMALHGGAAQLQANSPQGVTMRLVVNQSHAD